MTHSTNAATSGGGRGRRRRRESGLDLFLIGDRHGELIGSAD
jgi:hypothetical protein